MAAAGAGRPLIANPGKTAIAGAVLCAVTAHGGNTYFLYDEPIMPGATDLTGGTPGALLQVGCCVNFVEFDFEPAAGPNQGFIEFQVEDTPALRDRYTGFFAVFAVTMPYPGHLNLDELKAELADSGATVTTIQEAGAPFGFDAWIDPI